MIPIRRSSVVAFPADRIRDMLNERCLDVSTSGMRDCVFRNQKPVCGGYSQGITRFSKCQRKASACTRRPCDLASVIGWFSYCLKNEFSCIALTLLGM